MVYLHQNHQPKCSTYIWREECNGEKKAKYEKEEVAELDSDDEESSLVINAIRGGEPHEEHEFKRR